MALREASSYSFDAEIPSLLAAGRTDIMDTLRRLAVLLIVWYRYF